MTLVSYQQIADFAGKSSIGKIVWAHRVNSLKRLKRYLISKKVQAIEGDIWMDKTGRPVMLHPPQTKSDIDFETWFGMILSKGKHIAKLDFKTPTAVEICLKIIRYQQILNGGYIPIILNADVLQGPLGHVPSFDPDKFTTVCQKYLPEAILSLGWTTGNNQTQNSYSYTDHHIDKMRSITENYSGLITLPVRVCYYENDPDKFRSFLSKTRFSLSFWNSEPLTAYQLYLISQANINRSFYDISDPNFEPVAIFD